jgi:hypothetical protein
MSQPARYHIRKVGVVACAKFGCAGGVLAALPFGLLVGLLVRVTIALARQTLEGWQRLPLDLGLTQTSLDVVALLRLDITLARLRLLDDAAWLVVVGVTLVTLALLGTLGGSLGGIGALVYNAVAALSGGLAIDLDEKM